MKNTIFYSMLIFLLTIRTDVSNAADNADDTAERTAILATMDQAFKAIAANDPDLWRPILTEKAHSLSFRPHPDRSNPSLRMRERAEHDNLEGMVPGTTNYLERWTEEPTVMVRGAIATVWGKYDFWIDGKFSHCGVDAINLAKVGDTWKIAHFMWTVEPDDCASKNDPYPGKAAE